MQEMTFMILFIVFVVGTLVGCFWMVNVFNEKGCRDTAALMRVDYQWSMFTECVIQVDGKWMPLRNYRVVQP